MAPVLRSFGAAEREFRKAIALNPNCATAHQWYLEKAYEQRSGRLVYVGVERAYDPLRSDPRFQDLVKRLRLPA